MIFLPPKPFILAACNKNNELNFVASMPISKQHCHASSTVLLSLLGLCNPAMLYGQYCYHVHHCVDVSFDAPINDNLYSAFIAIHNLYPVSSSTDLSCTAHSSYAAKSNTYKIIPQSTFLFGLNVLQAIWRLCCKYAANWSIIKFKSRPYRRVAKSVKVTVFGRLMLLM
jgi:hypothetical protein